MAIYRWRLDKLQWRFKLKWEGRWSSFHAKGTNYVLVAGLNLEITGTSGMHTSLCVCCKTQVATWGQRGWVWYQTNPTNLHHNKQNSHLPFALPQIQVTREFWRAAFTYYISATTCFLFSSSKFSGLLWFVSIHKWITCPPAVGTLVSQQETEMLSSSLATPGNMGRSCWGEQGWGLRLRMGIPLGTASLTAPSPAFFPPPRETQLLPPHSQTELLLGQDRTGSRAFLLALVTGRGCVLATACVVHTATDRNLAAPSLSAPTPKPSPASSTAHPSAFMGILHTRPTGSRDPCWGLQRILA